MTDERQPGSELETRGETLPDVSVAHRAGSIVHEFVRSIVDEAEARGHAIVEEAVEEVRTARREAGAGAARIQERADAVAGELRALLEEVRREASLLSGEPLHEPALPPPLTPAAEHAPVEEVHDAEVVEAVVVDEHDEHDELAEPAEVVAGQNGAVPSAEETDDPYTRAARMSDEELARSYTNAIRAAGRVEGDDGQVERLHALAYAAVEEALTRPSFVDGDPEPRGLRRRARARKLRRRAVVLSELREACRQAREQQLAAGSPT